MHVPVTVTVLDLHGVVSGKWCGLKHDNVCTGRNRDRVAVQGDEFDGGDRGGQGSLART